MTDDSSRRRTNKLGRGLSALLGDEEEDQAQLDRLRQKYQLGHMVAAGILPMLVVHEDYLGIGLQHIDENYGSVEEYLEQALGVGPAELAELRGRYLE